MPLSKDNLRHVIESLGKESHTTLSLKVYRTVRDTLVSEYGEESIISGVGPMKYNSGRWMQKGICYVLYASSNAETAIKEFSSNYEGYNKKLVLAEITATVNKILDLTKKDILKKLGLTTKDLLKPWQGKQESLTQTIGRFAYESGFEGLLAPSKANPNGFNLVVFSKESPIKGVILEDWKLLQA